MRTIKNLTNVPYDLPAENGFFRVPAMGTDSGEFIPSSYFDSLIASGAIVEIETIAPGPASEHDEYEKLAGKPADKRWSDARLAEEIEKLKAE